MGPAALSSQTRARWSASGAREDSRAGRRSLQFYQRDLSAPLVVVNSPPDSRGRIVTDRPCRHWSWTITNSTALPETEQPERGPASPSQNSLQMLPSPRRFFVRLSWDRADFLSPLSL